MRLLELTSGPGGVTLRQLAAGCESGLVEDGVVFMSKQVYSLAKGGVGSAVGSTALELNKILHVNGNVNFNCR